MTSLVIVPGWVALGAFWFLCATAAGIMARLNGRSMGRWFTAGLALGAVGVVCVVIAGPPSEAPEPTKGTESAWPYLVMVGVVMTLVAFVGLGVWIEG